MLLLLRFLDSFPFRVGSLFPVASMLWPIRLEGLTVVAPSAPGGEEFVSTSEIRFHNPLETSRFRFQTRPFLSFSSDWTALHPSPLWLQCIPFRVPFSVEISTASFVGGCVCQCVVSCSGGVWFVVRCTVVWCNVVCGQ